MSAAPPEMNACWRERRLHECSRNKHHSPERRIGIHNHLGLRFARKQGKRQNRSAYRKQEPCEQRLNHGTVAHRARRSSACFVARTKRPSTRDARCRKRNKPSKLRPANNGRFKTRHAHAPSKKRAQTKECTERAHNSARIHKRLLRFRHLNRHRIRAAIATLPFARKRSCKTV